MSPSGLVIIVSVLSLVIAQNKPISGAHVTALMSTLGAVPASDHEEAIPVELYLIATPAELEFTITNKLSSADQDTAFQSSFAPPSWYSV